MRSDRGRTVPVRRAAYTPSDFTDDGALRIGLLLWAAILFLCRHLLIMVLGAVSSLVGARRGLGTADFAILYSSPLFLAASLPALVVLVAGIRRAPRANRLVRGVWRNGRSLLIISGVLDVALLCLQALLGLFAINEFYILAGVLDLYILLYLVRSRRVGDTFADFPAPTEGV